MTRVKQMTLIIDLDTLFFCSELDEVFYDGIAMIHQHVPHVASNICLDSARAETEDGIDESCSVHSTIVENVVIGIGCLAEIVEVFVLGTFDFASFEVGFIINEIVKSVDNLGKLVVSVPERYLHFEISVSCFVMFFLT
ncbi:hypothetical protein Ab1vBOLIVR5_gp99 [Agrobacterium phage OLIVR5]|uniref:Uncharacterized protein n=1 Tax=Agrobacterium phage OLIVR5 TaxID=2723773 RepID=A0A858MSJ4_9CAUD|nr:hypothetical protein KNU99_gp099 [Agrobacterium phage OLIVR5]QIW87747.1 hypothetical protein Ab1vBOLIVR5_gp99 [Agrobacterium phage OLIVR5]QIW88009.1 hypothetical protein Ab1vBOLIVR6_gp102 [Agrobacterium phage OLIVR6]